MKDIENGLLQEYYNQWKDKDDENLTYFVAHIIVHGHDYERDWRNTLDEAMEDLEDMKECFDEYDDAYVAEVDEGNYVLDVYD